MKNGRSQEDLPNSGSDHGGEAVEPRHLQHGPGFWLQLILLLWVEAVVAAYFWVHKPWPVTQLSTPFSAMLDIILALVLVALAGGIGRFVLRSWSVCSQLEMIALQLALGLGILSLGVLVVGLLGGLSVGLAWLVLALGIMVFFKPIWGWIRTWTVITEGYGELNRLERLACWLSVWLICLGALQALAPPLKWDSLVYHLELPRRYLEQGSIYHLSDNLFSGQPQLAEMIFTWAKALRSGSTAALLGWAVGVTGIVGVAGFAGRLLGSRTKWIATVILLSGASISRGLSWAYVDLWVLLFGLAATIILVQREATQPMQRVVLAGVYSGFALSTKYSAAILLPIGAVLLLIEWVAQGGFDHPVGTRSAPDADARSSGLDGDDRREWKVLGYPVVFGLTAMLVASPWFLKNILFTGNPIYPYFFQGRDMDALRQSFYAGGAPQQTLLDSLLLPINATILGIEGGPTFNTSISVLILAFLPYLFLGWRTLLRERRVTLRKLGLFALITWITWGVGSYTALALTRSRHYYAAFPALATLACAGYMIGSRMDTARIRSGWILQALVVLVIILTGVGETLYFAGTNPLRVISGVETETQFLADQLGWYGPTMNAINRLPSDSRVFFLWEPRAYYCQVHCSPDVILDRWWHLQRTVGDAHRIAASIRTQGFTHVLIYDLGVELERESRQVFTPSDWLELEKLRSEELFLISSFGDTYSLYATDASNSERDDRSVIKNEDRMSHE